MERVSLPQSLLRAVQNGHLLHAYLLESSQSPFPMEKALAFAQVLTCLHPENAPCGKCVACKLNLQKENPDIVMLEPDRDQIRKEVITAIREQSMTAPFISARKVFVIHRAECLNPAAQNAFLKLLEEPPKAVSFLLLSGSPDQLLPTILSRVGRRSLDEHVSDDWSFSEEFLTAVELLLSSEVFDTVLLAEQIAQSSSPRSEIDKLLHWFDQVLFYQQKRRIPPDDLLASFVRQLSKRATLAVLDDLGKLERELRYNIKKETAITATLLRCWEEIHDRDCGN